MNQCSRRLLRAVVAAATALAGFCLAAPPVPAAGLSDIVDRLDPHSCYVGDLVCVTVPAPLDHDNPADNRTLDIEYAIHLATGDYRGVLVYAVGGPGQAGVGISDWALWNFDERILEHYDIVLFDQRGMGPRHGVDCRRAAAVYSLIPWNFEHPEINIERAGTFVTDCITESGRAEIMPFLGTRQAVRDLEIFRQAIGAPPIWLYGASYGTFFAQAYAATFPDAVEGLILDSVMDPAADITNDGIVAARAAEDLFERMGRTCRDDVDCGGLFETSVTDAYDRLLAQLERAPIDVPFPLSSGRLDERALTRDMVVGSLSYALYTPFDRTAFLHALASADQGELVPMLRMAYRALEFDADTMTPLAVEGTGSGMYWGAFYAVSCPDYGIQPADPSASALSVFEDGLGYRGEFPRFFHYMIGLNLECQFWPGLDERHAIPLFAGGDFKTLILASDADHATPIAQATAVYERLGDATMITVEDGPHVVLGWGDACVDNVVTNWLVAGREPKPGQVLCKQSVLDPYYAVDVTRRYDPADAADIGWGAVSAVISAELTSGWGGSEPMTIGCDHGGTLTLARPTQRAYIYRYELDECRVWADTALTGTAVYRDTHDDWGWHMTFDVAGAHSGKIVYEFDFQTGADRIEGIHDGHTLGVVAAAPMPSKKAR
ncbi:MAG: alpha/beta fold hydrolase [Dongiaceae bacterium]